VTTSPRPACGEKENRIVSHSEASEPEPFGIDVAPSERVTAIAYPASARDRAGITFILGHGAGASQTSAFMVRFATALAARGIDAVTFNFVYTEARKRVPDRNDKLEACYRKVIDAVRDRARRNDERGKLFIGGKSMGGRIASQVAAADHDGVAGLVFLGYPLHPPGDPEKLRTRHWSAIAVPMLFVQGSRDAFGTPDELRPHMKLLKAPADLVVIEGGDHSFKVPKKAAMSQAEVDAFVLDEVVRWLKRQ
jgi:predicted alpha/beta-hydrolase family hydrolase